FSSKNILLNNTMVQCGILLNGDLLNHWNTHNIDITNTINGEPVYYWKNVSGGTIPSGAGEIILANCSNIKIYDQNLVNASAGILLGFTTDSLVDKNICSENRYYGIYLYNSYNNWFTNTTCTLNYHYGIYFDSSSKNIIDNCSIISNSNFDSYFIEGSENNVAIDTIFNTIDIHDPTSNLIIKNYLHIQANYFENLPLKDIDIKIKDNNKTVYSTPGYGGYKPKTNVDGQIKWIKVTDRIYNGSANATENKTTIILKYNNSMVIDNNKEIEMVRSHFEFFYFNILPTKIILKSPLNKSHIKDSTPELKWTAGIDLEGEPITYQVQIDELGDNWTSLVSSKNTSPGILKWNIPTPLIDDNYQWRVNANDGFGNGTWSDVWMFTLDTQPPSTTITRPENNQFYHSLNTISGTVIDPMPSSGVNKVEISIKRLSDNYYLSGSDWSSEESWLVTSGANEWEYNSSAVIWISDTQYNLRARGIDNANNVDSPGVDITFTIDADRPISTIYKPLNNTYLNNLSIITGNSIDLGNFGSGIMKVEISIKKLNDNIYWRKSGWSPEEYWLVVSGKSDWTYDANNKFWLTDAYYLIRSRATDNAGNIEHPGQGNTFMYDNKPPKQSITINDGEMYINSTTAILSLDGEDSGSGMSIMAFSPDGIDWTPWESFNQSRLINLPTEEGEKNIYFKVQDLAGNIAVPIFDSIVLDTLPPEDLVLLINNGGRFTNSEDVTLSLYAMDRLSGLRDMSFSNDKIQWTTWEPFASERAFTLPPMDGEKFIYFRVRDRVGNSAKMLGSVILDTAPPHSLSIAIDKEKKGSEIDSFESELSLKLNAIDDLSGLYQMSFSTDGKHWTSWEAFNYERDIALPSNKDLITIYFRVKDRGGNIAGPVTYNSTALESQPTNKSSNNNIYWVFFIIIIIIIGITVIRLIINRHKYLHHKIQSLIPVNPEPISPMGEEGQEEVLSEQAETQKNDSTPMEENDTKQTGTITISKPDSTNPIPTIQEPSTQQQPSISKQPDVTPTPIILQSHSSNIVPVYSSNVPSRPEHEI
ncbi:MAG: right-handed parallel beta-helix repeat-containing protein, partial [Thermoplasmata archaeon]|nr:right-handed parallel beta-helix repeat-containing protein [Thermoplasmata archaeon]